MILQSQAWQRCKAGHKSKRILEERARCMVRCTSECSVSQKIWLNLDHFRNCREFNSVWRISLAFANRPILHYGNGLRNIGGEATPAQIKVPSAFGKYAPFSIKAPPAR